MATLTITNNFYTWMRTSLFGANSVTDTQSSGITGAVSCVGQLKNTANQQLTAIAYGNGSSQFPNYSGVVTLNSWVSSNDKTVGGTGKPATYFGIGSGTTEATINDYKLASEYTQGVDYSIALHSTTAAIVGGKAILQFTITISAINNISVCEIGMFKYIAQNTASSNPTYNDVLLARCVLPTAVSLNAGESRTFDVSIEF